jgi:hypothetical protein
MSRDNSAGELISGLVSLIFFAWLGWTFFGDKLTTGSDQTRSVDISNPEYVVNYKSLADEFESNSVSAESKYEGKVIAVDGPIHSVDKDFSGDPYLTLSGEYDLAIIRCEIGKDGTSSVVNLRKGQYVRIMGLVSGTDMGVSLQPCRVSG